MKRYISQATKWLAVGASICGVLLSTGIFLAFAKISNVGLSIGLSLLGGLLGILFLTCFLAEKSRTLIIDEDTIVFPRGAMINRKTVFRKTLVRTSEITSIKSSLYKGDGLISKDTYFYTLKLRDGRNVTVTLYTYGKEAEKEILETIKGSVK